MLQNNYVSGDAVDLKSFQDNIRFDDWQLKILDDVEQNVSFKFICFADDGMPLHKETNVYDIFVNNQRIGQCHDRRCGQHSISNVTLKTFSDPGYPAFFYYTKTPFRSEHDAMIRSATFHSVHCDDDYSWDNGIDEAWYPTFDSLYDLLEHHENEVGL